MSSRIQSNQKPSARVREAVGSATYKKTKTINKAKPASKSETTVSINVIKQDFDAIIKNMIRDSMISKENSLNYKIEQLKNQPNKSRSEQARLQSYQEKEKKA